MEREFILGRVENVKSIMIDLSNALVETLSGRDSISQPSLDFITQSCVDAHPTTDSQDVQNTYLYDDVRIHVGTVHSVKGETHTATLYLETFFHSDGGRSFESERLMDQLKGIQIDINAGERKKQSSRVVYVGFSRPTHFLCFAVHYDRIRGHEKDLEENGWLIDGTLIQ